MNCKYCQSGNIRRAGRSDHGGKVYQRYVCKNCHRHFEGEEIPCSA